MNPDKVVTQYGTVDQFLAIYSEATRAAAKRLFTDDRMRVYWGSKFNAGDFEEATHVFELAHSRRPWELQSRRVQEDWQRQFNKAIDKLAELLQAAPMDTAARGFPIRDGMLVEIARRLGIDVPTNEPDVWQTMEQFNCAVDPIQFSIIDFLRDFQSLQSRTLDIETPQILSKPNDPQAPRAFFLHTIQEVCPGLSADTIATVASVMFQEDVADRKVRQHRPAGLSGKRKKPA